MFIVTCFFQVVFRNFWLVDDDFSHPMILLWGWISRLKYIYKNKPANGMAERERALQRCEQEKVFHILLYNIIYSNITMLFLIHEFALCLYLFSLQRNGIRRTNRDVYCSGLIYRHLAIWRWPLFMGISYTKADFQSPQCGERQNDYMCVSVGRARNSIIIGFSVVQQHQLAIRMLTHTFTIRRMVFKVPFKFNFEMISSFRLW